MPAAGVLAASSAGFLAVVANFFLPTGAVFTFLLSSSGAIAVVVYLCICATQIVGRRNKTAAQITALPVKMWGNPYLSYVVGAILLAIVVGMALTSSTRTPLALTMMVTAAAVTAGLIHQRRAAAVQMATAE